MGRFEMLLLRAKPQTTLHNPHSLQIPMHTDRIGAVCGGYVLYLRIYIELPVSFEHIDEKLWI